MPVCAVGSEKSMVGGTERGDACYGLTGRVVPQPRWVLSRHRYGFSRRWKTSVPFGGWVTCEPARKVSQSPSETRPRMRKKKNKRATAPPIEHQTSVDTYRVERVRDLELALQQRGSRARNEAHNNELDLWGAGSPHDNGGGDRNAVSTVCATTLIGERCAHR